MLVVAAWLVLRAGATSFQLGLMVAGYALLEMALVVLAVPILLAESIFLLSLVASPQLPAIAAFARPARPHLPANAQRPE
jgi:hypothetical protein